MEYLFNQIDNLKGEAEKAKPYNPKFEQAFWSKFRLEFNYNSNHIEGSTLTYGHTQLLLLFDKVVADYNMRELEEMKAHDLAWKIIKEECQSKEHILTEKFIKEINELILVRPFFKDAITPEGQPTKRLIEPGNYKKYPNSVLLENGEIFKYASPEETPALMGELIEWFRHEDSIKQMHPVQLAALIHYRFVRIHPFDDSNGRTSRLLMNYVLMRNEYAPIVIKSSEKKAYLTALNKADIGDIDSFIKYIAELVLEWQNRFNTAIKGVSIEEQDDIYKEISILKQSVDYSESSEKTLSSETLWNAYNNEISSFLKEVFTDISTLDNFFLITSKSFKGQGSGIIKDLDSDFTNYVRHLTQNNRINPFIWEFLYKHKNLSKIPNINFEYINDIKIDFKTTFYEISSEKIPGNSIKKLYHQNISNLEKDNFKKLLLKAEVTAIKLELGE